MSEWKEYRTIDLLEQGLLVIGDGYRAKNIELSASKLDGLPFARVGNINEGFNFYEADYFPINNLKKVGEKISKIGDVVFTSKGTVGRFAFVNDKSPKFVYSPQLCFWRSLDQNFLLPRFLLYWMQSKEFFEQADAVKGQTDMADYVNLSDQRKMKITLPKIQEQTAIASVLSSLDDKIDLLHRQNATLEKMAETLFRQWFVEEAKEEWEETTLDKHTEAFRGLSYKGSGLTEKGMGLPMHNLNSVYEGGGYKHEGIKFYSGEYRDRHLVQPGDIIVANTEQGHEFRLIGFPAIVPESFGQKGLFSQHIYKLIPLKDSYLTNEFIYYLLMVPLIREQITAATNGSTVNMLAIDGLQRPQFKLPPKETVEKFTSIISDYWKKQNINQTQIRTLTTLRDTLLPKLMSGEVTVKY